MPRAKTQKRSKVTLDAVEKSELNTDNSKQVVKKRESAKKEKAVEQPAKKSSHDSSVDIEKLKAELLEDLKKEIKFETSKQMHAIEAKEKTETSLNRSELVLSASGKTYTFAGNNEGLSVLDKDAVILKSVPSRAIGINTASPKVFGPGSVHIKSNYSSEAALPSSGTNSTRGLLLESDSDDEKSYLFRAVSRQNRQGLNLTGDGSLILGLMNDTTRSRLAVYQPHHNRNVFHAYTPTRYYNETMLNLETASPGSDAYNFIQAKSQCTSNGDTNNLNSFVVSGKGDVKADGSFVSNHTGYAEMFEWADNNSRNENRYGFTVALNAQGKLIIADEGDDPIGVVVKQAAIIGNTAWNHWKNRFLKDDIGNKKQIKYNVIEWHNHDSTLTSNIDSTMPRNAEIPESAITYETDESGKDLYMDHTNSAYQSDQEYINRLHRQGWAIVQLYGTVRLYKGQWVDQRWQRLRGIDDSSELWFLR